MVNRHYNFIPGSFLILLLLGFSCTACAIDNPDSVDYVAKFEQSSMPYLKQINNPNNTTIENIAAYSKYRKFLEKEMSVAYGMLKTKLNKHEFSKLTISQKNWVHFRNSEFAFIDNNWTRKDFGSSYVISRGDYKCTIIKNRILELLNYAKNY